MATAGVMPALRPGTSGVVFTARPALRTPNPMTPQKSAGETRPKGPGGFQAANPQLSIIEVESMLREKVKTKYQELLRAFKVYDVDQSQSITKGEFRRVLESFCFPMTTDQFDSMYNKVSVNSNGTVRFCDFLDKFCPHEGKSGKRHSTKIQRPSSPREMNPDTVEKMLREKIQSNLKDVLKGMRLYDYNSDGHIQRHELRKVLESFCFRMTDQQFDKLYARFDFHHRGVMNYKDFLMRLGVSGLKAPSQNTAAGMLNWQEFQQQKSRSPAGALKPDNNALAGMNIDQIEIEFRKLMRSNYADLKRMFLAFDKHLEGFIEIEDLKSVLNQFTVPLSEQLFAQLMQRFGIKASGKISWEFFLEKFQDPQSNGNGQTITIKPSHKYFPVKGTDERMDLKDLITLLHNHVLSAYGSFKEAFLQLDKNRCGKITRKELKKVMKKFQLKIADKQFQELMSILDPDHTNSISYQKFLDLFETKESKDGHKWLNSVHRYNDKPKPAIMAWETIQDIIVEKLQENWTDFSSALVSFDHQTTGRISPKELRRVVEKFTIPISDAHFDQMLSRVTDRENGKVNYIEFLIHLGVTIKPGDLEGLSTQIFDGSNEAEAKRINDQIYRQTTVEQRAQDRTCDMTPEEVITRIKDRMLQHTAVFRKNFNMYDKSGKGKISKKDFRLVIEGMGLFLTNERFKELCSRLAFKGNHMTYTDFVASFEDPRIGGPSEQLVRSPNHKCYDIKGDEKSMSAIEVESKLRSKLRENFENLRGAFYKFDEDHNGILTKSNFRRMLDTFMLHMSDEEYEKLCQRLGLDKSTKLSYIDFLKKFEVRDTVTGHKWLFSDHRFNEVNPSPLMTADQAHAGLVEKAHRTYKDLANAFRSFNASGKGQISKKQMKALLNRFILPVSPAEFNKLWARYDPGGKGYVNHNDFLENLAASEFTPGDYAGTSQRIVSDSYSTLEQHHRTQQALQEKITHNTADRSLTIGAWDVLQQMKDRIRDGEKDLHTAFKKYDTRQKGYLTPVNIQKILIDYNYYLDDDQFYDLLQRIGLTDAKSRLTYEDFCHFFEEGRPENYRPKETDVQYSNVKFASLPPEEVESRLQRKAMPICDVLQKAFQAFDKGGTGRIATPEFRRILDNFCFKLTDAQFKHITSKLVVQDNTILYSSFMEQYAGAEGGGFSNHELFLSDLERELKVMTPMPMSHENIVAFIQDAVQSRFQTLAKSFAEIDFAKIGAISKEDFRGVLNEHVMRLDNAQFEKLWDNLPVNEFGNLEYHNFLRVYMEAAGGRPRTGAPPSRASSNLSRPRTKGSESRSNTSNSSRGRRSVQSRGEFRSFTPLVNAESVESKVKDAVLRSWKELQKLCRNADQQGTGKIDSHDFKSMLHRLSVNLSEHEMDMLLLKYDLQNTGEFSYNDFLRHFVLTMKSNDGGSLLGRKKQHKPILPSTTEKLNPMQEAMCRVQDCVRMHWKDMRRDFRDVDPEGAGVVCQDDFRQIIKNYNVNLSEEEFYHVATKFDHMMKGVDYDSFIKSYLKSS